VGGAPGDGAVADVTLGAGGGGGFFSHDAPTTNAAAATTETIAHALGTVGRRPYARCCGPVGELSSISGKISFVMSSICDSSFAVLRSREV